MQIKNGKDFWAGLMFLGFGLGFMAIALNYPMGSAVRMGPAYFPTVLGGMCAILGGMGFFAESQLKGAPMVESALAGLSLFLFIGAFGPRSMFLILFAVVIFGYALKPLGLVLATVILIVLSAVAGYDFRKKEIVILAVVLALFGVYVFVKGLGLPFNLCPDAIDQQCSAVFNLGFGRR